MPFCKFDGCFANYDKLWRLQEHELKHTGERPFVCTFEGCGKSYRRSSHLNRHAKSHSDQKDYVCVQDGCQHRFVSADNLKKHLKRFHQQCHKCEFDGCGATFKKRQQLTVHEVIHTGINRYHCEVEGCGMQFPLPSKLKRHMQKHEMRNCPKDGCSETFKSWSLLRKHLSTDHLDEFKCESCGKTFGKNYKLRLHERIHKEKVDVFLCPRDGCGRTYTRVSYLQMHIDNYHEGARPFVCTHDECTKTFAHKVSLEKHQVVHMPGYVKPQPKPRKKRSTASKISGVVVYTKLEVENRTCQMSDVEDDNMTHVKNLQAELGSLCTNDTKIDADQNASLAFDKCQRSEREKSTLPPSEDKIESMRQSNHLESLTSESGNKSEQIYSEVHKYKNLVHEKMSNSVAISILESIECQ
ncbi:transcription factor IIIA-like [Anneissia japonica]|uniref:transcription factor IIIA-like n=1 Tax=Anneissia japonica TaxID=1529436 RepID=UPI001425AE41|nr:transcription factor IIIA-like [Anneissia japonica]